ncbi:hypothetical protein BDR26DRAFT_405725 [Obelidium mucronatum]|nr:hypothetical protein BDR26DRAFT_405725 [Obelidium mucronatum]
MVQRIPVGIGHIHSVVLTLTRPEETPVIGDESDKDYNACISEDISHLQRFWNEKQGVISFQPNCRHPQKNSSIYSIRKDDISGIDGEDSLLLLFLDHCESFVGSDALSHMILAHFAASETNQFVFPNILDSSADKDSLVEIGFSEDEFNPYDAAVGTTSQTRQNDMSSRSAHPPSTSMLIPYRVWQSYQELHKDTSFRILGEGAADLSACNEQGRFWVQFSLWGIRGLHIPIPLLATTDVLSDSSEKCKIDIRKIRNTAPEYLSPLSLLKSIWRPSVSVIVPFYNVPHPIWFLQTLKSLAIQSFSDFEIIIVNDGSNSSMASTLLLAEFEEMLKRSDGLWDGDLPPYNQSINDPYCNHRNLKSLVFGNTPPPHYFEELPPQDIEPSIPPPQKLPARIIHHPTNRGLAETRNTGVRAARGHNVFFLDPDDILTATALEKLSLLVTKTFGPAPRSPSTRIAFLHMPVMHFPDPIKPICQQNPIIKTSASKPPPPSAGIDSNKSYVHNANPPPPSQLSEILKTKNPLTSTSVVSRWDYMAVGGSCPRTTIRFFEDYDFWLRMLAFGRTGVVGGEPGLFWYRRHDLGMSSKIMKESLEKKMTNESDDEGMLNWMRGLLGFNTLAKNEDIGRVADGEWLHEGRVNNPVAFGDLTRREAERLLRLRNARRRGTSVEEGIEDESVQDLNGFMPCYRTFDAVDPVLIPQFNWLWSLRKQYQERGVGKKVHWYSYTRVNEREGNNGSLVDPVAPLPPLYESHVFPFNPSKFESIKKKAPRDQVLYMLPWMVTGGADLYDKHVLAALSVQNKQVTLVVARNLETHPHPWSALFTPHVDEIFHLQHLSNDTKIQRSIVEYLAESRISDIAINSRTVVGYELLEKWGQANKAVDSNQTNPSTLIDILHLHHPPTDNTNWEHRSARISNLLTHRIVVSEDLKAHLVNILGHGDATLGKPEESSNSSACMETKDGKWLGGRCVPLSDSQAAKISIIYPPLDFHITAPPENSDHRFNAKFSKSLNSLLKLDGPDDTTESGIKRIKQKRLLQETRNLGSFAHQKARSSSKSAPALFYVGRFEDQKDPLMWVRVASKARELHKLASKTSKSSSQIHMVGTGSLMNQVYRKLKSDPFLDTPPTPGTTIPTSTTYFHYSVPHSKIPELLLGTSNNGILLMTSRLEGMPIVVLESLGLGIPVVSMECGGTAEAMLATEIIEGGVSISNREGIKVARFRLGSLIHVPCEDLARVEDENNDNEGTGSIKVTQSLVEDIMASEVVRLWRDLEANENREIERWIAGKPVRTFFALDKFRARWNAIFN